MKKEFRIVLVIIVFILMISVGYVIIKQTKPTTKSQESINTVNESEEVLVSKEKQEERKGLINVDECSEDFMQGYFDDIKKINEKDNNENVLIVISKKEIANSYGATDIVEAPNNQYILQYDNKEQKEEALSKFKEDESICSVDENTKYTLDSTQYNSWGISATSIDYAIDSAKIDLLENVTVAIIDSGCDLPLVNKYYPGKIAETYDVIKSSTTEITDEEGHGTHVTGTISEGTPSNVKVIPIKIASGSTIYSTNIISAINYVSYYKKADVINMSFGSYDYNSSVEQAIDAASAKNIVCVAAAGNDNRDTSFYPASLQNTISISSVTPELNKSSFSNYGDNITFAAPGTSIKSLMGTNTAISKRNGNADNDDDHETISGTSMAAPHAVCAVAIVKGYNKNLDMNQVIEVLKRGAVDLGTDGWDYYYGYGLISFKDILFRDRDEYYEDYGVFKVINEQGIEVTELNLTKYNYYSQTNLLGSKIRINKADGTSEEKYLWEVPSLEILNYNPTNNNTQQVTIKVKDYSTTINVKNPTNYQSGWEYEVENVTAVRITGYKSHGLNIGKLYVPETLGSRSVVSFKDNLRFIDTGNDFLYYKQLYLPKSFYKIGDYNFYNASIESVYSNCNYLDIGAHAFEESNIKSIDASVYRVRNSAFKNDTNLEYVNFTILLEVIEDYAFYNCKNLKEVDVYQVKYKIGNYAFYNSGITKINWAYLENGIGESAFENCKNLKSLTIGEMESRIERRAFWNTGITDINLSGDNLYISEDSFAYSPVQSATIESNGYYVEKNTGICDITKKSLVVGFDNYNSINISEEVEEIGNYAFTGNNKLNQITVSENLAKIGQNSFKDCKNLSRVCLHSKVVEIGDNAFDGTQDVIFYAHKDSEAKQYLENNDYQYRHFEPDELIVIDNEEYKPGASVKYDKITVKFLYHEKEDREETLAPMNGKYGFYVSYQDDDAGEITKDSTYYIVHAKNEYGYELAKNVEITFAKEGGQPVSVSYKTHIQDYGWQGYVKNGALSGTSGESKRLEGIKIKLTETNYKGSIEYRTHVQDIGWQGYVSNGAMAGTEGKSYRLEAIQIRLKGDIAEDYDIYYRVHCQNIGWMNWAKNDEKAGTAGYAYRLEGIEIVLVEKGKEPPKRSNTQYSKAYKNTLVAYRTHVQDYGWQDYVLDGKMSGTTGESKRLEGINIFLANPEYSGGIKYRTHVQNIGWQNYVTNGTMAGTVGKSYRLEAIQIKLTGEIANYYDVYYRVHCQNIGWMDWAKNDEKAGTAGYSYRLEGIEIKLIEKGKGAPGNTKNHYREK